MEQTLFDDGVIETPETQAIKYTGSKLKLLPYILNLSKKVAGGLKNAAVFDGFSVCGIINHDTRV
jgi:adenine-specific DNA-methyltransferase